MLMVRLQRRGTKKTPHHRIVVTEKTRAQSGRVVEILGYYDPAKRPEVFQIDEARAAHWTSVGAQVSDTVQRLFKKFRKVALPVGKR